MTFRNSEGSGARVQWLSLAILFALLAANAMPTFAQESAERRKILRPGDLLTARQIERFVLQVLSDTTKRQEPFIKTQRRQQRTTVAYEIGEKPRPTSGFASFDIDQLGLMAIWKERDRVTAMFRAIDGKLLIAAVGEEAFDGMVVEISFEGKYVKFMRKLERVGPKVSGQPDYKFEPVLVRMRK